MDSQLVDDVREELRAAEPLVVTGAELARDLDESKQHVLAALRALEHVGAAASKRTGANAIAWWAPERVSAPADATEHAPTDAPTPATGRNTTPAPTDGGTHAPTHEDAGDLEGAIAAAAADLPGSGRKHERRREALALAVAFVRERGDASAAEIREHAHAEVDTGYSSPRSLWKNALLPALSAVADRSALEKADETGRWRWRE